IQYQSDQQGNLSKLPARHVDTGAGFERIVAVLQNKKSNYDTDLFTPIFDHIADIAGKTYTAQLGSETDNAFRVIADHLRMLTFAITDGATPGNDGRGYVLRRILRRATRFGLLLDLHEPFIHRLVPTIVENMGAVYPELNQRLQHVQNVILAEEKSFLRTLERGIVIFENDVMDLEKQNTTQLPGEKAFRLYDTFGFPLDLTQLMAAERNVTVDVSGFDQLMVRQRELARASQKDLIYQADVLAPQMPATDDHLKYQTTTNTARLLGYVQGDKYITKGTIPADTKVGLVFDKTCAYAEAGGQIGDQGTINSGGSAYDTNELTYNIADETSFIFDDTVRIGDAVVHFGSIKPPSHIIVGQEATITIDSCRQDTQRNHTATHLLQWALQKVLGSNAHQEGSLVCPDYLRFDFTHHQGLTHDEITRIETLVCDKIDAAQPVTSAVLPIEQAQKLGAMALFSEKYGETVRVLAIGADSPDQLENAFSREFCGGAHVNNTADIGSFKIIREESVATGIRRITAYTGAALNLMLLQRFDQYDQIATLLKTSPDQILTRIQTLLDENKKLKKQLEKGAAVDLKSSAQKLLDDAQTAGEAKIIVGSFPPASPDAVRSQIDWLRQKAPSSVTVLAVADLDKVQLYAAVTNDLIENKKLKAGDIVKTIAPIVEGRGGGRPQLAQAGGKNPKKIPEALNAAANYILEKLA
ncbi:MAG: alanine--tRNA ligase, partial [Planctomycetes bacterium]|nr:alanine--tRNA ligase [Planctomycetota bacterium]